MALAGQAEVPYAPDGRTALEKILNVMSPAARERAERLAGRVWMRTAAPAARSGVSMVIEQGLVQRRVVVLNYQNRFGRPSRRRVEPHLLAHTNERWYLVGWCHTRQAPRWFRWDRIAGAHLTPEPVLDPAVFGTPPPDARPVRTTAVR